MTAKALAAPLLLALALSACSSAPQHPAPQLPDTWFSAAGAYPATASHTSLSPDSPSAAVASR